MQESLKPVERRVLGVLLEKSLAQPSYYPMTLNAVVNACNQKSNRDPTMNLNEDAVWDALDALRERGLVARMLAGMSGRVDRFKHEAKTHFGWEKPQRAVMAELLLRGPQTVGELRSRCADVPLREHRRRRRGDRGVGPGGPAAGQPSAPSRGPVSHALCASPLSGERATYGSRADTGSRGRRSSAVHAANARRGRTFSSRAGGNAGGDRRPSPGCHRSPAPARYYRAAVVNIPTIRPQSTKHRGVSPLEYRAEAIPDEPRQRRVWITSARYVAGEGCGHVQTTSTPAVS